MVSALIMSSQLRFEIIKGKELSLVIETFLILSVTPFNFAIMSGRIRADGFVLNSL